MMTILDILRGWLTLVLLIVAAVAIMYFGLPGFASTPADTDRGRTYIAIFGGFGLLILSAIAAGVIADWYFKSSH